MTNETEAGIKRLSWLPDRDDSLNGDLIGGQDYNNVYITGGTISGVNISGVTIDASELDGTTLAANVVNSSLTSVGTLANLTVTNPIIGSITGSAATAVLASTVTTNANLTGAITSTGNATSLNSFSSSNLLTALTDKTGTGVNVFATAPTISSLNTTG